MVSTPPDACTCVSAQVLSRARPVLLLEQSAVHTYLAQSGLVSATGALPDHTTPMTVLTSERKLADGQSAPDALLRVCERAQIPMFATPESSAFVIDVLRAYLSKHFADRTTMHGVFMDIWAWGC